MFTIAVIGCGAIGLTTAIEIQNLLGYNVEIVIVTEGKSPKLTSDIAAGLWTPYSVQNTAPEKIYKWSKATFEYLVDLWKKGEAESAGISLEHVLRFTTNENYEFPDWLDITLGHEKFTSEKLATFSEKFGENFTAGYSYVTFIWEASKFLPYLEKQFLERGGRIDVRKVTDLSELKGYDVIVNCTGLAARELVPDSELQPIRGQIVRVLSPWQHHTLMFDTKYIIPNQDTVVLGGTLQLGDYNLEIDQKDKREILAGCAKYVPALRGTQVVEDRVGLRPGRPEIRLEVEERMCGDGVISRVVHNYGHGGSGITLAVGCAKDAAELTKRALERKLRHKL